MSDTTLRRGGLCEIWPWDCPNTATLVVYGEDDCLCGPCLPDVPCGGHVVCDEHGALLRIEKRPQLPRSRDSRPFVVVRLHTLTTASA